MNTMQTWTKGLLPLAVVMLAGCGGDNSDPFLPPLGEMEVVFAASLGVDLATMEKTELGIWITDEVVGEGNLVVGLTQVDATVQGWLPDGTLFEDNTMVQWITATGATIPGFDGGVIGMRVGGIRKIVVPPALGFGTKPPKEFDIPVNSWLVFRVQVTAAVDLNTQLTPSREVSAP